MMYSVFLCKKCGGVCAAREGTKTFRCTYCGTINHTDKGRKVATGVDSKNIQKVIGELKAAHAKRSEKETL